jgi:hypothetical protein
MNEYGNMITVVAIITTFKEAIKQNNASLIHQFVFELMNQFNNRLNLQSF